jgi:uncharacterized membrane protein
MKKGVQKKTKKEASFLNLTHPIFNLPKTFGEKASDWITKWAGSWVFIILFLVVLLVWMGTNGMFLLKYLNGNLVDPYPFILLNLALSCLAAIQAPVILMSQNRENHRDRLRAQYDYAVNRKAEKEIREIKVLLMRRSKKK